MYKMNNISLVSFLSLMVGSLNAESVPESICQTLKFMCDGQRIHVMQQSKNGEYVTLQPTAGVTDGAISQSAASQYGLTGSVPTYADTTDAVSYTPENNGYMVTDTYTSYVPAASSYPASTYASQPEGQYVPIMAGVPVTEGAAVPSTQTTETTPAAPVDKTAAKGKNKKTETKSKTKTTRKNKNGTKTTLGLISAAMLVCLLA